MATAQNGLWKWLEGLFGSAASTASLTAADEVRRLSRRTIKAYTLAADSMASDTVTAVTTGIAFSEQVKLKKAYIVPAGAATANDTNYATFTLAKVDGAGGADVTLASQTTETTGTGNLADEVPKELTISVDQIEAGSVLTIAVAKAGSGVQLPLVDVCIEVELD